MRYPSVAGTFYTGAKDELSNEINGYISKAESDPELVEKRKNFHQIIGLVVPHAGHIYSGPVAAYSYSLLKGASSVTLVIIGPNHTGRGKAIAISREDWTTPLGTVKTDIHVCDSIKMNSQIADFDEEAHKFEHSIEVQLPFIQSLAPDAHVVEICMGVQDYSEAEDLANAIVAAAKETRRNLIVIASSDMTHFEASDAAKALDERALNYISQLKAKDFINLVQGEDMSICGYGPIATAMLWAAKNDGKASILKYANSGDVTGDYGNVVGYASVAFYK